MKNLRLYNTDETIPLFNEVLEIVKADTSLFIEIKKHKNIGILENNLCGLLSEFNGDFFICSFEKDILYWFKKHKETIKRGLIFESLPNWIPLFYQNQKVSVATEVIMITTGGSEA